MRLSSRSENAIAATEPSDLSSRFRRSVLLLIVMLIVGAVIVGVATRARNQVVADYNRVLRPAQRDVRELLTAVVEQESGQRSFVLTGDEAFLGQYTTGQARSVTLVESLNELFANRRNVESQLIEVEKALIAWRSGAAEPEIAAARDDLPLARQLVAVGDGARLLDELRFEVVQLSELIDRLADDGADRRNRAFMVVLVGAAMSGCTLAVTAITLLARARRWATERDALLATERRLRAEKVAASNELEQAAVLFHAVINTVPVGIAVFDPQMRFMHINDALAVRNGVSIDDHIGRTPHDLFPEPVANQIAAMFQRAVEGDTVLDHPIDGRTADDGHDAHLLVSYFPTRDRTGSLLAVGCSVVDITDQTLTARSLSQTAALLDAIIDESPMGFAFFGLDRRYQRINKTLAEVNGVPAEATIGRTVAEVLPDLADTVNRILDYVATNRQTISNIEVTGQTPAQPGVNRQWMSGFYPVSDAQGDLIGLGVMALEITQLRTVEQRLRDTIATIQASFLPAALANHPVFEFAATYRAASIDTNIGGDFYDTTLRHDGSVAVTIGDVCGHDIEAAMITSVVRHTISAAAQHVTEPAEVLRWANQAIMQQRLGSRFVTVAHGTVRESDAGSATLELTLAGHPHPVMLGSDGVAQPIGSPGTLIGVTPSPNFTEATVSLSAGDQIVFYTDGLAENAIERLDEQQVTDLFARSRANTAQDTTDLIMRQYDGLGLRVDCDDVAVLVIHYRPDGANVDGRR